MPSLGVLQGSALDAIHFPPRRCGTRCNCRTCRWELVPQWQGCFCAWRKPHYWGLSCWDWPLLEHTVGTRMGRSVLSAGLLGQALVCKRGFPGCVLRRGTKCFACKSYLLCFEAVPLAFWILSSSKPGFSFGCDLSEGAEWAAVFIGVKPERDLSVIATLSYYT